MLVKTCLLRILLRLLSKCLWNGSFDYISFITRAKCCGYRRSSDSIFKYGFRIFDLEYLNAKAFAVESLRI